MEMETALLILIISILYIFSMKILIWIYDRQKKNMTLIIAEKLKRIAALEHQVKLHEEIEVQQSNVITGQDAIIDKMTKRMQAICNHPIIRQLGGMEMVIIQGQAIVEKGGCTCPGCTARRKWENKDLPMEKRLESMSPEDIKTLLEYSEHIEDYETASAIRDYMAAQKK